MNVDILFWTGPKYEAKMTTGNFDSCILTCILGFDVILTFIEHLYLNMNMANERTLSLLNWSKVCKKDGNQIHHSSMGAKQTI